LHVLDKSLKARYDLYQEPVLAGQGICPENMLTKGENDEEETIEFYDYFIGCGSNSGACRV
jgi:hypothetical protein